MSANSNRIAGYFSAGIVAAGLLIGAGQLMAAGTDASAGSWQMIVLNSPTQIIVPAPAPPNDAGYQAELAAVKSAQGAITKQQRQAIDYWNRGGVLNWNQIEIGLVAAMDLPPEPNADGTYTFPAAATPFAFPSS